MTDSGSAQFPGAPRTPAQASPGAAAAGNARILVLPDDLRAVETPQALRAEVIRTDKDGHVRLRTARGEIAVKITDRAVTVEPGDTVEVQIPPGRPPLTARVAPTDAVPASRPPPAQTPQSGAQNPAPDPAAVTPRPAATPVAVDIRPPPAAPAAAPPIPAPATATALPAPVPFAPDLPVRLIPITTQQAAAFLAATQTTPAVSALTLPAPPSTLPTATVTTPSTAAPLQTQAPAPAAGLPQQSTSLSSAAPDFNLNPAITMGKPELSLLQTLEQQAARLGILPEFLRKTPGAEVLKAAAAPTPASANLPLSAGKTGAAESSLLTTPTALERLLPGTSAPSKTLNAVLEQLIAPPSALIPATSPSPPPFYTPDALPPILANHSAGAIAATVIGKTPQNFPVVHLTPPAGEPASFFTLFAIPDAPLAPGTQLILTPQTDQTVSISLPGAASLPAPLPGYLLTPAPWPLLQDIYQTLAHAAPQAAQALSSMTPSPAAPQSMNPLALFFIAAVRSGDLFQWLGDKTSDLLRRAARPGLLERLSGESAALSRLGAESLPQDWRAMSLPLFWQGEMHKIALHYKGEDGQDDPDQNGGKQTRFIFDLRLDRIGPLQLDGLLRGKRLDLIVRSETPFSQTMQMEMRRIYTQALEQSGLHGEMSFQNRPEQWVTIRAEGKNLSQEA